LPCNCPLDQADGCPEFSLSPKPKQYSAIREVCVDSLLVGCEPTRGEETEVKTDAINVAYNMYKAAVGDNALQPNRRRGDRPITDDEGRSMEINLGIHLSAPKARLFIIGKFFVIKFWISINSFCLKHNFNSQIFAVFISILLR
jgi:hypothetical protein